MSDALQDRHLTIILDHFYHWETAQPNTIFLRQPFGRKWRTLTYAQAGEEARRMATALHEIGLQCGDHVGIISKNCYHWVLADLAVMMAGLVSVPFYASLPADALREVIELSDIKAIFVGKLDTWGNKGESVPAKVRTIAFPHYTGNAEVTADHNWDDLVAVASPLPGRPLPALDDLWTILFTSGTTGTPKGVMHTYRNPALVFRIEKLTNFTGTLRLRRKKWFSFLPLNHVAERIGVLSNCLVNGGSISFAESIDTFADNLRDVQPSFLFAVPRIWTKFYQAVTAKLPAPLLNQLFGIPILGGVVKRYLRRMMGLAHVEVAGTGAAITPAYLKDWYRTLGIHLVEAYGMTEVCGSICNGPQAAAPPDAVGTPVPYCDVKIDPGNQEILMRAPYQMTGYYRDSEKTALVLRDGWIHSGDRGTLDEDGYVRVIGRISDAFKTTKGQFIVPNPMEERMARHPFIEQVCVVGLGCPHPLALINLSPAGQQTTTEEVSNNFKILLYSVNCISAFYHHISTFIIDNQTWSEDNQLLTPTQKVRRSALDERYGNRYTEWHEDERRVIWL